MDFELFFFFLNCHMDFELCTCIITFLLLFNCRADLDKRRAEKERLEEDRRRESMEKLRKDMEESSRKPAVLSKGFKNDGTGKSVMDEEDEVDEEEEDEDIKLFSEDDEDEDEEEGEDEDEEVARFSF